MAWFDCATRRPISHNHGGALSPNRGLVLHHQVGRGSLHGFFNNPAAKVSTHFWVGLNGTLEQYIPTNLRCWGGMNLNGSWVQIETEGCAAAPHAEPMTEAMINALARLFAEGMRRHGWPARNANGINESGLGFHRMAGSGAATACICDVRLNMRATILQRASGGAPAPAPPPPAPPAPAPGGGGAPPFPGRIIRNQSPMMQGADIQQWQTQMRARGWTIDVDGWYGPGSAQVARQFQAEKGLAADGEVGPQTWAASWNAAVT